MFANKPTTAYSPNKTTINLDLGLSICQADYPLDWYQEEFVEYAERYQALPDRKLDTVYKWMKPYVEKAKSHFGDELLLLAHYYMGGEIVKLIEHFGGLVGDSYQLALMAAKKPEKSVIIESAVHFMAESISILAHQHQNVYITNPKSGCTMEMMAKDFMVEPALLELNEIYGQENILPICYMNTSGRIKALTGAQGGAVCTSSNVLKIFQWAMAQNKKVLFIPDKNMGENVAHWMNIKNDKLAHWPGGSKAAQFSLFEQSEAVRRRFDEANIVLFDSYCAVHDYYNQEMVEYWQTKGYTTIAHPECRNEVIRNCCHAGSTAFIWQHVTQDQSKTAKYAVATENHMVENLRQHCLPLNIDVVNLADVPHLQALQSCGCATMSRNDPPHLVALLDLLRKGHALDYNRVKPGDMVNEFSGIRQRLSTDDQELVIAHAKKALQNMIDITENRV